MNNSLPKHRPSQPRMVMTLRMAALCAMVVAVPVLHGCASPATVQGMTVSSSMTEHTNERLKNAIRIENVSGGKETNPLWTSQVGPNEFRQALEGSLGNAGYLANSAGQAKYALTANLLELDQPLLGLTLDVTSKVQYQFKGEGIDKSIPISATGTATFSDAAVGITRLRIANEKSILENIKALLKQLAEITP